MGYFSHINDVEIEAPSIVFIFVVSGFSEVFPNDLLDMPMDRDIDSCIDLDPGIHCIYIPMYIMSLE